MQTPTRYSLQHNKENIMRKNEAQTIYEAAIDALLKYCDKETNLTPEVLDEKYPFQVQFLPRLQQTIFGNENVQESGEINDMTVTVGLTTTVKSTLKFKMESKQLKKLIKLAEALGHLYYQAFREEAGELPPDVDLSELLQTVEEQKELCTLVPVYCKDCLHCKEKHYEENGEDPYVKLMCKYSNYAHQPMDFCSNGERRGA